MVSPAICSFEDEGSVFLELIIGRDGAVKMVDVLSAPLDYDVQAAAAQVKKATLTPGTLDGQPVTTSWFTIIAPVRDQ